MEQGARTAIIAAVSAMIGAMSGPVANYFSSSEKYKAEEKAEIYESLRQKDEQINDLKSMLADVKRELKGVMERLSREVNFTDWQQSDIDSVPWPIAIKRVVKDDDHILFPNLLINNSFADEYGISKWRAKDETSAKFWTPEIAGRFYELDMLAWQDRTSFVQESCYTHRVTGKTDCNPVLRRYLQQPDNSETIRIDILKGLKLASQCDCANE